MKLTSLISSFMFGGALLFVAPVAFAQTSPAKEPETTSPPKEPEKPEPKDHTAYISISPIHLLLPVVELTGEFRLHERIGVAAIGGVGSVNPYQFSETKPVGASGRFFVWEVGGQFVTYPVGHFDHGMQLGAEVLYAGVSGHASTTRATATGTAQGLALSPFIGYKFTAPIGFSFNIQGGISYLTARAEASSGSSTASAQQSSIGPLLNLNLGWAF